MNQTYLHRKDAPFGANVWEAIDKTVTAAAKARLAARRLLSLEGPYGLALQSITAADEAVDGAGNVRMRCGQSLPVPGIEGSFSLSIRNIAAFEATGQPLDLSAAARAAAACADQEDALIFQGSKVLGVTGLLTAKNVQAVALGSWKEIGHAVDNILQAVTKLASAGFQGPYALALAPPLFNGLFRRYPQTAQTELEHLRQVVTDGIVSAAALSQGGVLVTAVKELASIVIGQDLETAYVGPAGRDYTFAISETLVLRLNEPSSVCVLK